MLHRFQCLQWGDGGTGGDDIPSYKSIIQDASTLTASLKIKTAVDSLIIYTTENLTTLALASDPFG